MSEVDRELDAEDLAALQSLLAQPDPDVSALEEHVRSLLGGLEMWDDPVDRTVAEIGDVVAIAGRLLSLREELLGEAPREWLRAYASSILG